MRDRAPCEPPIPHPAHNAAALWIPMWPFCQGEGPHCVSGTDRKRQRGSVPLFTTNIHISITPIERAIHLATCELHSPHSAALSHPLHSLVSPGTWFTFVLVWMCVRVWMEDDPPTLSHIGWGALAVRGAHLLNTGLTHCLRGRIRGKRVTPHSPRPRGGLCERACVCVWI